MAQGPRHPDDGLLRVRHGELLPAQRRQRDPGQGRAGARRFDLTGHPSPPFSRRLDWRTEPNRISRAVDERRAAGLELLDLTESNPTAAGFDYPPALAAALADPRALTYSPTPRGLAEARTAVAGYYQGRGLSVDPERLLLTASTSEAYSFLFKLLADPGDQLLVPRPSYPLFDFLAALESVTLAPYPLRYDGSWYLDETALRATIGPRTRAILVVHPNNPTGSFLKRGELDRLNEIAVEHGLAIISDEVFGDYFFASDPTRVPSLVNEERALTFCLSGLSKVVGLPQLKLGWIHVSGPPSLRALAEERLELIADTYLSVGAPVQHAAATLLERGATLRAQIAARTADNLRLVGEMVRGTACQLLHAEGGWYATLRVPRTRSEEQWVLDLISDGVLCQPGWFFDFEDEAHLVLSLLTPKTRLQAGLTRLLHRADST